MTVETASTINQLNITLPADPDPIGEGNEHLRLIKSTLLTTFPNITNPVTAADTDLNQVPGTQARVTALEGNRLRSDQSGSLTGTLTVSGGVVAASFSTPSGGALVPSGVIVMWSGPINTIPVGWHLCDGTNGTPNLAGQFVLAASLGGQAPYASGGNANIALGATDSQGAHDHGGNVAISGAHNHTGNAQPNGAHAHAGATDPHTLTLDEIPSHSHSLIVNDGTNNVGGGQSAVNNSGSASALTGLAGGGGGHVHGIEVDGVHSHAIITDVDGSHGHIVSTDGAHTHNLPTVSIMPPWFALAYIMKL